MCKFVLGSCTINPGECLPKTSSQQKNSQIRASFISALSTHASALTKMDELQQKSLDRRGSVNRQHQSAATMIHSSQRLLQRYERLRQERFDVNESSTPEKEWVDDCRKFHDLFDMQESRTKEQVNDLLSGEAASVRDDGNEDIARAFPKDVWTLFAGEGGMVKEDLEGANGKTWTEITKRAQRDVRRLLRHIEES